MAAFPRTRSLLLAGLALCAGACQSTSVQVSIFRAQSPVPCEWELAEAPPFDLADALARAEKLSAGKRLVQAGLYREGQAPRCLLLFVDRHSLEFHKIDATNGRPLATEVGTTENGDPEVLRTPAIAPARALALALATAPAAFPRTIVYRTAEGAQVYEVELLENGVSRMLRVFPDGSVRALREPRD